HRATGDHHRRGRDGVRPRVEPPEVHPQDVGNPQPTVHTRHHSGGRHAGLGLRAAPTPAAARKPSKIRAPAVTGKPVSASWMAPRKFTPASSMMMLVEITRLGETFAAVAFPHTATLA